MRIRGALSALHGLNVAMFSIATNFTGFRGSFIAVKICSTFNRSPIHTRLSKEFDDQIKLHRPAQIKPQVLRHTLRKVLVKTLIIFCVALLGCISLVEAAEPQLTGNQLVPSCREYLKKPQAVSACAALLRGVFEGHLQGAVAYGLLHNFSQFKDLPFVWCPTDKSTVSDAQLVALYTNYVSAKPEVSERPAANIAATVFMLSWPCRN